MTPTTTPQPHAATGVQKIIFTPNTDRTPKPVKAIMSTFHEGLHTQTNLDSATKKTHEVVMKTMLKNLKGGLNGPRCDGEALVKMIAPPTITVIRTDRIEKMKKQKDIVRGVEMSLKKEIQWRPSGTAYDGRRRCNDPKYLY